MILKSLVCLPPVDHCLYWCVKCKNFGTLDRLMVSSKMGGGGNAVPQLYRKFDISRSLWWFETSFERFVSFYITRIFIRKCLKNLYILLKPEGLKLWYNAPTYEQSFFEVCKDISANVWYFPMKYFMTDRSYRVLDT